MKIILDKKDLKERQRKGNKALISRVVFLAMKMPGTKLYGPDELDLTPRKALGETEMKHPQKNTTEVVNSNGGAKAGGSRKARHRR